MGEECVAVCSKCNQGTTGKIYKPYWCSDCKIKGLEEQIELYKEQYDYAEKRHMECLKAYNEETKYRNAFEALFEKISQK